MNILFIHHVGAYGGSSRSMMETINELTNNGCKVSLICPKGDVSRIARENSINVVANTPISQFYHSKFGYYKGFRWIILLRELLFLIPNLIALLRISRKYKFDIVHINEYSILFSLFFAKRLFKCPVVTHVRALQENNIGKRRYRFVQNMLYKYSSHIIAIDENVYSTLENRGNTSIIHNSLKLVEGSSAIRNTETDKVTFAMIGVMLKYKGVWEFVKAAKEFQDRDLNARFVFIGGRVRAKSSFKDKILQAFGLYEDVVEGIEGYIADNNLKNIEFHGFKTNLEEVYRDIDVVCFPSHLDAPGRPVLEAALYSKPCIVALSDPKEDTVINGTTALCIKEKDHKDLFDAMFKLYNDNELRGSMGKNANELAKRNFDLKKNTQVLLSIYKDLLTKKS